MTSAPTANRWSSAWSSTATAFPRHTKSSTATPRTAQACRRCSTRSKRAWAAFAADQMVVVDRGMAFDENLEQLRARGLRYLVASRHSERSRWLAEFETLEGFDEVIRMPSPRNPRQPRSKSRRTEDETFGSAKGVRGTSGAYRLHARGAGRLADALRGHRPAQGALRLRHRLRRRRKGAALFGQRVRRELAERLDGSYVLKSDRTDLGAEEAWRIYHLLTRAENAFRCPARRAAYLPSSSTTRGDPHLSVRACLSSADREDAPRSRRAYLLGERARCTGDSRHRHHRAADRFRRDDAHPQGLHGGIRHRELYRLLGVDEKIVSPKTIWSETGDQE